MHSGPICQSCAMPLEDSVLGTDENVGRVSDYCHHCLVLLAQTVGYPEV